MCRSRRRRVSEVLARRCRASTRQSAACCRTVRGHRFHQRGFEVIPESDCQAGHGGDDAAEPATGAMASSTPVISSSVAPAASARVTLHSRQTAGAPVAATAATRASSAVWHPGDAPRAGPARAWRAVRQRSRRRSPACARSPGTWPPGPCASHVVRHHSTSCRRGIHPADSGKPVVIPPGAPAHGPA